MIDEKIYYLRTERTGSTFLINIFYDIFGRRNVKYFVGSKVRSLNVINAISIRDFRDSIVSFIRYWRLSGSFNSKLSYKIKTSNNRDDLVTYDELEYFLEKTDYINEQLEKLKQVKSNKLLKKNELMIFKYEKWYYNYDVIFNKLEKYFNVNIDKQLRNEITEKYSYENIKTLDQRKYYSAVKEEPYKVGLVNYSRSGDWKLMVPEDLQEYLNDKLKDHLLLWGYKI